MKLYIILFLISSIFSVFIIFSTFIILNFPFKHNLEKLFEKNKFIKGVLEVVYANNLKSI
jgi:hypothetical protein